MAFRKRVETVFEWIQPTDSMTILDLPCGRGFYLKMLRHATRSRLVGADLDPFVLRLARANVAGLPGISLHHASAYALPYADATFDAVILSELLEHLDDDVAALREVKRVLRPGGVAVITVPNADYPFLWDPLNWLLERVSGRHISRGPFAGIWANHVRLYRLPHLRDVVRESGLAIEAERSFTHHTVPFAHNLVYGLGKPLLESGWLGSLGRAADRTAFDRPDPPWWNPIALAIALLQWVDRRNVLDEPSGVSTVNLAMRVRKPRS